MARLIIPSRLVFGAASIAGLYEPVSDTEAAATLAAAWDAGIRTFDTAPHYGVGVSERRLGDFLAGRPRDELVVSTKVGRLLVPATGQAEEGELFVGTPPLSRVFDFSADGVLRSLEESLGRLRLDRVDVALIHDPGDHMRQALDEAYPALVKLRDQGVAGAIGVGVNSADLAEWFVRRCDLDCVLVAGRYTLLEQPAAASLFPLCLERGVSVLAGGVFNSGILAGGDRYNYVAPPPEIAAKVAWLRRICAGYDVPLAAVALRYVLRHPAVTAAVVGARTPAEIEADVDYLSVAIPDDLFREIEQRALDAGFQSLWPTIMGFPGRWPCHYFSRFVSRNFFRETKHEKKHDECRSSRFRGDRGLRRRAVRNPMPSSRSSAGCGPLTVSAPQPYDREVM
jgi:D-threo-aldose 1-dehydrogenase